RILVAAEALGIGWASLRRGVSYASERIVFGHAIGTNQGVSFPLADAHMRLRAAEFVLRDASRRYDDGRPCAEQANTAKYLAAEAGNSRNKRSVTVDLKTGDGRKAFRKMLAGTDVLVSNWRPGVAEGFGLTADDVAVTYPRLVWVRISGYGQDGPRAGFPAFDSILQAKGGGMAGGDKDPALTRGYTADNITGAFAAQSALAALHARHAS